MLSPDRFKTPRRTILVDRFMTGFIKIGGLGIITAVMGIFVFIVWQVLPLFRSAQVTPRAEVTLAGTGQVIALGLDEWSERPFVLGADGTLSIYRAAEPTAKPQVEHLLRGDESLAIGYIDPRHQRVVIGTSTGHLVLADITFKAEFTPGVSTRQVVASVKPLGAIPLSAAKAPPTSVAFIRQDDKGTAAAIQDGKVLIVRVDGDLTVTGREDLTSLVKDVPERLVLNEGGDELLVASTNGEITYLHREGSTWTRRQAFRPFADQSDPRVASLTYLLGDVSVVLASPSGANRIYSLFIAPGDDTRRFGRTKEFPALEGAPASCEISVRNKAFLMTAGNTVSLRFATTETIRWEERLNAPARQAVISAKYDRLAILGADSRIRLLDLADPHPEAGFKAFFGKVWYEGFNTPKYEWQSTGGTDDFEPKLSMINLIFGTFKGTFYALFIAVPIALTAAIYTAEFMHPRFKMVVKPTVEVMAALPSVVLGFLAALWLAPRIEERVPSILCVAVLVPVVAALMGIVWSRMPPRIRTWIPEGWEFIVLIPLLLGVGYLGWSFGPVLEGLVFTVPVTSIVDGHQVIHQVGDFRQWWPKITGLAYESRNSLVVGFMMGFAVIPIIFTISEDALTNVPRNLRSASLALGASRWQTAFRIVVPTASAGIFSALMIGLGRAIGETMIVVMATGNTGIMEMNIFNGMRTLSANIAVELPEAPAEGTLFRTLFLGALLLFLFTFAVNTVAEIMRARLREKYKTV